MTGDEALERLLEGNRRFVAGTPEHPRQDAQRRAEQAEGQTPFAVILGCSDSRVPPEVVFDQGVGDLFVVRVAGNTAADQLTLGSIEFGVSVLECPLLLVLGHEKCGAVTAAVDTIVKGQRPGGRLDTLVDPIAPAVEGPDVTRAVDENVRRQASTLASTFPTAAVVGTVYSLATGGVSIVSR